ncbi:MAG: Holliday junction branch migration DNA helicase RuvB, partial [Candidatus Omnitrophica bacterium]|nr:Holliday junction branch migration DNA helicase RuvB [Candidatus Omnitrophota bacterium]
MEEIGREKFINENDGLVGQCETEEDVITNLSLRPKLLKDFIGQEMVVDAMDIALQASLKRDEPLEHLLFSGPPGLGKTSLAHII